MDRAPRRLLVPLVAASCLLTGLGALAIGVAARPADQARGTAAVTTGEPATIAATATTATTTVVPTTIGGGSTTTAVAQTTTTHPAGFVDSAEARDAAQTLVPMYIQKEYGAAVTDAACSLPPTGAVGDEFVCYALRQGDLVIALRATIGEQQLITLALITDQGAPTTTTTTVARVTTTTAA
jgi:hypothetical protein